MKIYNSLTRNLDLLVPLKTNKISIYVCGITPYDTTHLGHAFTYLSFDTLIKYLKYKGYEIAYTQNVTDINDRDNDILKKAQEQNTSWQNLADYWTKRFLEDMHNLNWTKPNHYLFASQQISAMVKLIEKLIKNGMAYEVNNSVYLDISKDHDYGKLSRFSQAEMLKIAGNFEEDLENPDKRNPLDITLWRTASPNQPNHIPSFDSPYGKGRPGWHVECSAMAISSLGEQIDIHGGGVDLTFPHHEAEIAQSEEATGKIPFVKYWLHTGAVFYQGEKMSKSLGNLVMVSKLLEKYSANAIRWVLLSHHWQKDWEFKEEELDLATQKLSTINNLINCHPELVSGSSKQKILKQVQHDKGEILKQFEHTMEDNLNTPKALDLILKTVNGNPQETPTIQLMLSILGFKFN